MDSYIESVLDRENGEYINAYKIQTTPEQEAAMLDIANELGDGMGFNCADNVSEVLKELDFSHVFTPGGLEKQLKESDLVKEVLTYEN